MPEVLPDEDEPADGGVNGHINGDELRLIARSLKIREDELLLTPTPQTPSFQLVRGLRDSVARRVAVDADLSSSDNK